MRNLKKALALVLALMMTLSLMAVASAADQYTDKGSVTKTEAVDVMSAIKVFQGDNSGSFNPAGSLRRSEAAKIIAYMKLGPTVAEALPKDEAPFPDVKAERWHTGYIAYAKAEGIIDGRTNGNFDPDATLTGYEFGKMVLEAAGISGEYTGSNWKLNINTALRGGNAAGTDLMKNVDAVLSMAITREQACQLAFNALNYTAKGQTTGNFVIHAVSTSSNPNKAQVPDGAVCASRTEALMLINMINSNLADNKLTLTADYTIDAEVNNAGSLAADVFKLTSDTGSDAYGAPAKVWKIDGKAAVTVANAPALSYTKAVKGTDIAKALSLNAANIDTVVVTDGKAAVSVKLDTLASIGGKGAKIDVYNNGTNALKIVVVNTYLGTIKDKSYKAADATKDQNEQVAITMDGTQKPAGVIGTDIVFETSKFTKEDEKAVVLYTVAYDDDATADYKIVSAEFPNEVTGTPTRSTANNFVMGGTTYEYGDKALIDNDDVSPLVTNKTETTFYTDNYGYVLGAKDTTVVSDDVYAYLYDVANSSGWTTGTVQVKLLGTDGKMNEVTISKLNGTSNGSDPAGLKHALDTIKGQFVKVEADGSNFALRTTVDEWTVNTIGVGEASKTQSKPDGSVVATLAKITRNTISLATKYTVDTTDDTTVGFADVSANSKTVFLFTNENNVLSTYTGITNVPSVTFVGKNARAVVKDGVALVVYAPNVTLVGGGSTATEITFIAGASASSATDADKGPYTTYNAVINGEITTIETAGGGLSLAGANKLCATVTKNDKDLITSYTELNAQITDVAAISKTGTAAPANGIIALGGTKYVYDDNTKVYFIDAAGTITAGAIGDVGADENDTVLGFTTNNLLTAIFVQKVADPSAGDATLTLDATLAVTGTETKTLTATFNAGTSGLTVSSWAWTSADEAVFTVTGTTATGSITGVAAGGPKNVTVTATLSNGAKISKTCAVTVAPADVCEHTISAVSAKSDATCQEFNYDAHYKCSKCNQLFSDADGKTPINDVPNKKAGDHNYTWSVAGSDDSDGVTETHHKGVCQTANCSGSGHVVSHEDGTGKAAGCNQGTCPN